MSQDTEPTDDGGQGASLDALLNEASAIEGASQVKAAVAADAEAASTIAATTAELLGALQLARDMAAPTMEWWPEFHKVWSDAALAKIAASGATVMQMHGWTMAETWAKLGPYIALAASLGMPALVTWQAVKARQAQMRAAERRPMAPTMPAQQSGPLADAGGQLP